MVASPPRLGSPAGRRSWQGGILVASSVVLPYGSLEADGSKQCAQPRRQLGPRTGQLRRQETI